MRPFAGSARPRPPLHARSWRTRARRRRSDSADAGSTCRRPRPGSRRCARGRRRHAPAARGGALPPRGDDCGHLVVVEVGHGPCRVVVVANDLRGAAGAAGPVQVVAGRRLGRVLREHRQVVGEHEHAAVVGIRRVDTPAERREGVLGRHLHLVVSDHLPDPWSRAAVRGEQHPLGAERVPAQFPGHGLGRRSARLDGQRLGSHPSAVAVTVIVPAPVGRITASARPSNVVRDRVGEALLGGRIRTAETLEHGRAVDGHDH